jgi:hypothetical protein
MPLLGYQKDKTFFSIQGLLRSAEGAVWRGVVAGVLGYRGNICWVGISWGKFSLGVGTEGNFRKSLC